MKEFKCARCKKYLGEMSKGKLHKTAHVLCDDCIKFYEQCDRLLKLDCNKGKDADFLGDILKGNGTDFLGDMFKGTGLKS